MFDGRMGLAARGKSLPSAFARLRPGCGVAARLNTSSIRRFAAPCIRPEFAQTPRSDFHHGLLAERDPAHLDGRFDIREVARFLLKFFVLRPEGGQK
jgi:hypothetical protein